MLTDKKIIEYVMGEAAKSNVEKRQVGCVIVGKHGGVVEVIAKGYNTDEVHAETMACEHLIANAVELKDYSDLVCYVTHQPCPDCAHTLLAHGVTKVEVVEAFMKFDGDKTRYDLVDPEFSLALFKDARSVTEHSPNDNISLLWNTLRVYQAKSDKSLLIDIVINLYGADIRQAETEIAEVLTFGARKYKPNNWRKCVDTGRYLAACFRHLNDWNFDPVDVESGKLHRAHIATNLMFLFCLEK